jgi:N-acetylglutamate synthase-like GNAT family acetyltransferase
VAAAVARAATRGFPSQREAICIVEYDGEHAGSLALTDEGDDAAALRWFVFDSRLRGHGLGRRLLGEMLTRAEEGGYARVWLETFSELEAAAHLYREHGFSLLSEDTAPRWGTRVDHLPALRARPRAGRAGRRPRHRGRRMLQLADQRKEVVLLNHMLFGTLEVRGR